MTQAVWLVPEGLRVDPDGAWSVGGHSVVHGETLHYLKARLVFEEQGAFVVDGGKRVAVDVQGPAFVATTLVVDHQHAEARLVLDDGTQEMLVDEALALDPVTGRFECRVRGGRARALLSRTAHQILLDHIEEEGGSFALEVGPRSIAIRT